MSDDAEGDPGGQLTAVEGREMDANAELSVPAAAVAGALDVLVPMSIASLSTVLTLAAAVRLHQAKLLHHMVTFAVPGGMSLTSWLTTTQEGSCQSECQPGSGRAS